MDHQAFAQLLGNYGEFIGAIAVVGTLIYLAIQVKQSKDALDANTRSLEENRRLTRADAIYNFSRRWDEVLQNAAGTKESASVFVRGNKNPGDLDHAEQVMYLQQLVPFFGWHLAARQMADEGFLGLSDELNDAIDEVMGRMLRKHPGVRACWDEVKHTYAHRDHVDALIERAAEGEIDDAAFGDAFIDRR